MIVKPRLEPVPFTDEDCLSWIRGVRYFSALSSRMRVLLKFYQDADRRDADLMLRLGRTKALSPPHPTGRAVVHSLLSWSADGFNVVV